MRDPVDSLSAAALGAMVGALREHLLRPGHTLRLHLADDFIALVESNSRALLDRLAEYFCEFLAGDPDAPVTTRLTALQSHPPPIESMFFQRPFTINPTTSPRGPKESWLDIEGGRLVRKLRTGMVYLFGGRANLVIGDCLENESQVVNFINNRLIQARLDQGCLLGHAAAVTSEAGRTIMIAGFPGMGKSTLSLKIMARPGAIFLSNDRVMFGPAPGGDALWAYGVPKHPRINPGTILHNEHLAWIFTDEERARFTAMDPAALWDLERKYDGLVHRSFGPRRFRLAAPLTAVALLNWRRDAAGSIVIREIDPNARRDLLPALMKSPGLFYTPPDGGRASTAPIEEYIAGLAGVKVYELAGAVDFDAAAETCARYLMEGAALDG